MIMFMNRNNVIRKNICNILLIQLGDIGDVVLSLPSIRALKENFQQANVIVAVREKAKELIEDCPWATGVIAIDKNRRSFIQEIIHQKNKFLRLRRYHFDLAIDLRTGTRGAILAMLSGARQRVGFYAQDGKLWRNRLFTHLVHLEMEPGQHMLEYYQNLLKTYKVITENIWPELFISAEKGKEVIDLLIKENVSLDRPTVALQPFSLWQYKEWGVGKYIDLIHRINDKYEISVIITGSPEESEKANKIIKKCGKNVYNFAGKTSIGTFAALLKACHLFIGGDSAGVHIAAAVGTPTVSIFGPISSDNWAPRGTNHNVVYKSLPCVPCHQKGCQGSGFSRCLDELTVDEVMSAVERQINNILIH